MPTYDYQCDACGHALELFQKFSDPLLSKCPACGKETLRRLFGTGAAIVFKGSGFYQTDYRSESYKSAAAKESKDAGAKSAEGKPNESAKPAAADNSKSSPSSASKKPDASSE